MLHHTIDVCFEFYTSFHASARWRDASDTSGRLTSFIIEGWGSGVLLQSSWRIHRFCGRFSIAVETFTVYSQVAQIKLNSLTAGWVFFRRWLVTVRWVFFFIGAFTIDVWRNFDKMQIIFKAITGSSGYTFWGKESAALYGWEKNLLQNHGAGRCLGKFSLLGNIWHLSVP